MELCSKVPILGICLAHQAIVEALDVGEQVEHIDNAKVDPMHRKESKIFHDQETMFKNIPNPIQVIRYHSLAAKGDILPQDLKIIATADDDTIMAVLHKEFPVEGVHFHPESIKKKPHSMKILEISSYSIR